MGVGCRKDGASVEDIDYFMCQCEMMDQLQKEYYTVERVVSKCHVLTVRMVLRVKIMGTCDHHVYGKITFPIL